MKKHILVLAVLIIAISAHAQTKFGVHAGVLSASISTSGNDFGLFGTSKMNIGFKAGLFAEVPIFANGYFSPELNFVRKGGRFSNDININETKASLTATVNNNYLEVPLNVMYKLSGQASGAYFGAGPVVGLGLKGRLSYSGKNENTGESLTQGLDIVFDGEKNSKDGKAHLKPLEVGANIFAGYAMNNGVRVQLQYRPDFTNLNPNSDGTVKSNYIAFTVGYIL